MIGGAFLVPNEISEAIVSEILDSQDGDYIVQAQMLAQIKPSGW
jgi:hypothetical protein